MLQIIERMMQMPVEVPKKVISLAMEAETAKLRGELVKEIVLLRVMTKYVYDALWYQEDPIINDYIAIKIAMLEQTMLEELREQKQEIMGRCRQFLKGDISQRELRRWLEVLLDDLFAAESYIRKQKD